MPLFGDHEHVRGSIESLLEQTYTELAIVVCDDGGGSREHLADLLGHPSVAYRRNEQRLGLIGNWRRVFELGRALHPDSPYYAWASDHDLWEPGWAAALANILGRSPDAVLAYPRTARIEVGGAPSLRGWTLETVGIADPIERLQRSYDLLAAGDMVYGLFRTGALERCGVFPEVIAPDRLLLAELALQGTFVQVPEVLWNRRKEVRFSLDRQRSSLFGGKPPWHARLPWWVQHLGTFTREVVLHDQARLSHGRATRAAAVHASLVVRRAVRRFVARAWTRTRLRAGEKAGRWLRSFRSNDEPSDPQP